MKETGLPMIAKLEIVPQDPGVYLMKDTSGFVIYVGKAVNLRNRLRSYFTDKPQGTAKVMAMISHIADFETIICHTETEALMLESTLIKKHQPLYNILLRDDRDYPYVKVTMQEQYPRVMKAYRIGDDKKKGARYYGPYLSGHLKEALAVLRSLFPIKTCRRVLPRDIGKERPCLNYYIGRCIGPCKGDVSAESYRAVMEDICRFFEGKYGRLLENLRSQMETASAEMQFESAVLYRDRLQTLERLINRQKVVSRKNEQADIIGHSQNNSEVCLQKLEVRDGRLVSSAAFFFSDEAQGLADLLHAFLLQHYPDQQYIPPEILLPAAPDDCGAVNAWMKALRGGRCELKVPQKGTKKEWIDMANMNARESLYRHTLLGGSGQTAIQEVLRLLSALAADNKPLHRIEAIDISNTGEQDYAASLVVFQDGRPARQQYRRFKIEPAHGIDDYAAMQSVLRRRLSHLDEAAFGSVPDLILLDGGKGHVSACRKVLEESGLKIPLAGMVKDQRHRTRGIALENGQLIELRQTAKANLAGKETQSSWIVSDSDPESSDTTNRRLDDVRSPENLSLLRFLTAVQDEAHRFAGSYRKKLQHKRTTRFSLESIPGVGPARRKALLKKFLTIKGVTEASLADLQSVPGISQETAEAIYRHFRQQEGNHGSVRNS